MSRSVMMCDREQTETSGGGDQRVSIEAIPLVPFGATVQSWNWAFDSGRTGLLPNWMQYTAPWNGSNLFALTFSASNIPNTSSGGGSGSGDPAPVSVSFRGTVKFTRSFLIVRGQPITVVPSIESVDQTVTILVSIRRSTPSLIRFPNTVYAMRTVNGSNVISNTGTNLGPINLVRSI